MVVRGEEKSRLNKHSGAAPVNVVAMPARDEPTSDGVRVQAPLHPVAQLQGPFEESMVESANDFIDTEVPSDSVTRRTMLLDAPTYERVIAGRWKQKPGEKYHPLWKLIAQISFGMHLLAQGAAKSEGEVVRILQTHVDDIDTFLERTTEDIDLALNDIQERLQCLALPLKHVEVFDRMLEDRSFRASILEGNQKIDHIVSRTKRAAKDALKDVRKGLDGTDLLEKYLSGLDKSWKRHQAEHEAVFVAMQGNVEGWHRAFAELRQQGHELSGHIKHLAAVMADVEQRAIVATRRQMAAAGIATQVYSPNPTRVVDVRSSVQTPSKPLPEEPTSQHTQRPSSRLAIENGSNSPWQHSSPYQGVSTYRSSRTSPIPFDALSSIDPAHDSATRRPPAELPVQGLHLQHAMHQPKKTHASPTDTRSGMVEKDNDAASSIYYPQPLKDLLKSPTSPQIKLTPVSLVTHVQSPFAGTIPMTPREDDYPQRGRSPAARSLNSQIHSQDYNSENPAQISSSTLAAKSDVSKTPSNLRQYPSPIAVLAFTSHQSVMTMASPPAELPAGSLSPNVQHFPTAIYELGLPSPTHTPSSYASPDPSVSGPVELPAEPLTTNNATMMTHRQRIPRKPVPANASHKVTNPMFELEAADSILLPPRAYTPIGDDTPTSMADPQANVTPSNSKMEVDDHHRIASPEFFHHAATGATTKHSHVSPQPDPLAKMKRKLPSDSSTASPTMPSEPTTANKDTNDSHGIVLPVIKPFDFEESLLAGNTAPRKLKLTRKDGKLVPINIEDYSAPEQDLYREDEEEDDQLPQLALSTEVVANILDSISHTPPESPIHARSSSMASSFSGRIHSERSSRSLGSTGAAPPPPGPSGRPLNLQEYANAGAFEGERRSSKRSNSGRGWKVFLGPSSSSINGPVMGNGNTSRTFASGVISPTRSGTSHSGSASGRPGSHTGTSSIISSYTSTNVFTPIGMESVSYTSNSNTLWLEGMSSTPEVSRV